VSGGRHTGTPRLKEASRRASGLNKRRRGQAPKRRKRLIICIPYNVEQLLQLPPANKGAALEHQLPSISVSSAASGPAFQPGPCLSMPLLHTDKLSSLYN
jgi:hypothetical protein